MSLIDDFYSTAWNGSASEVFQGMTSDIIPGHTAAESETVVLAAAAIIIARRSVTEADIVALCGEVFDLAAFARANFDIRADYPPLALVGGRDADAPAAPPTTTRKNRS